MALTTAQMATIKADILANPTLNAYPANSDGAYAIAQYYNQVAAPDFIVWRQDVTAGEIGNAWSGSDIDGMSSLNMQRLQLLLASSPDGVYDMSRIDRRDGFLNPFGTNQSNPSRVAMLVVFKRKASNIEKLLSSGTGTTATPATMGYAGAISYQEILAARAS